MAAPVDNPITLDLSETWGSALIGTSLSLVLFGVGSMQAYLYYWTYAEDSWRLKLLVACLWGLAASHDALALTTLWGVFVHDYGGILKFAHIPTPSLVLTWLQTITACTVQLFFIRRVWLFDTGVKYWPIHIVMILLSFWSPIAYTYVLAHGRGQGVEFLGSPLVFGLGVSSLASEVAVDIFIAIFMIILLSRRAKKSSSTKGIIHRLQVIVINTGLFTAIIATIALIIYSVRPATLLDSPFYFTFSSAYFCCLLTNLNARRYVRGENGAVFITDLGTDIAHPVSSNSRSQHERPVPIRLLDLSASKAHHAAGQGVMVNVDIERIPDANRGMSAAAPYTFVEPYSGRSASGDGMEKKPDFDYAHNV